MKLIPEEARYAQKCYFCGRSHDNENPVAFELDIDEIIKPFMTEHPEFVW